MTDSDVRRPTWLTWLVRTPSLLLIGLVRLYQLLVSPLLGQTCRFYPSCSAYAVGALREHGAVRGTWLTVRRLARCHPWNPGGVDPVPQRAGSPRAAGTAQSHPQTPAPSTGGHIEDSGSTSSTTAA